MNAEEHIRTAMAEAQHELGTVDAAAINEKLTQALFCLRRQKRDRLHTRATIRFEKPQIAVVNHYRDRVGGIHVVDGDGDSAA